MMFGTNDRMRPAATPERVLAVCRIVAASGEIDREGIIQQIRIDPAATTADEPITDSLGIAVELGFLKKKGDKYQLEVDSGVLASYDTFRRAAAPLAFKNRDSMFFKLSEWYIAHDDVVKKLNRYQDVAASASVDGMPDLNDRDVLGWRFWARFFGILYLYNRTLIPNMKVRLEDALRTVKAGTRMNAAQFSQWLQENIPEGASSSTVQKLPLSISNGLRTLEHEGKIEMLSTRDAVRTTLYPIAGLERTDFSLIEIKEMGE